MQPTFLLREAEKIKDGFLPKSKVEACYRLLTVFWTFKNEYLASLTKDTSFLTSKPCSITGRILCPFCSHLYFFSLYLFFKIIFIALDIRL